MPLHGAKNFNRQRSLTPQSRAYFKVRLFDGSGRPSARVHAQLDTGADHTILPVVLATQLGYLQGILPRQSVRLANGSVATFSLLQNVHIGVERHKSPPVHVLLAPQGMPILLAARDLIAVTEFGLDAGDIYFD